MRITAQVLHLAEFTKYGASSRVAQSLLQLLDGGDLMLIKKLHKGLQMKFCRLHNEIISPTDADCQGQCSHFEIAIYLLQICIYSKLYVDWTCS